MNYTLKHQAKPRISKFKKRVVSSISVLPIILAMSTQMAQAQVTLNTGATNSDMANELLGSGLTLNSVSAIGDSIQSATYSNGNVGGAGFAPADTGLIFMTGNLNLLDNGDSTNDAIAINFGDEIGTPGDPDINSLSPNNYFDASGLIVNFTASISGDIELPITFLTEEFPIYYNSGFSDIGAVFLNGSIAPATGTPNGWIEVDALPASPPINNGDTNDTLTVQTDMNAGQSFTIPMSVVAGNSYTIKIVIADQFDGIYDSALMIGGGALSIAANIVPVADTGSATSGTASTPVADVTTNDMVNGAPVDLTPGSGNATISEVGTWPAGLSLDPATGAVEMDGSTPPGTYTLEYEICDTNTPANCETAEVVITVDADIVPVADTGSATSGTASTPVADVTTNDMVNGAPVDLTPGSGNATISEVGTWPAGLSLDPATGAVEMDGSTPPGTYTLEYEICDTNTPANCETAEVVITVDADIVPVADTGSATSGTASTPVADVTTNDMVNGAPVDLTPGSGNATISEVGTWPAGLSLDPATGAVEMDGSTPPGTYTLEYEICDTNTPANCETAEVVITVDADIVPVADTGSATSGTASTPVADVTTNDMVNGAPVDLTPGSGNATISEVGTWPAGLSLDPATGAVEMDGSTPPGTYTLEYEICDTNTPANCETAEVVITVDADIVPVADTGSATSGTASTPVADVTTNDMVNGAPVDLTPGSGNATISEVGTWPAGLSLDPATGAVEMDGSTPPGTYTLEYEICDTNTPANCETAEVVITVDADIVPVADTGSATSGTASTPVADVTTNDMVNGAPVDLTPGSGNATISEVGTWPAGLSLDPATGAVEMDGSTPPGTYTLEYEICDTNTPANCETAEVVITVDADIVPVADTGSATSGTASTPVADVTTNDMVNGAPVDLTPGSGNATISEVGTWPAGLSLDPATGAVEMDGSTPPGTYTLEYEICDTNTPANCETAEVVITVDADIVPVADTGSATSGTASTPVADVTTNDMVNGAPVDLTPGSGNATISEVGTWPAGLSLDPATGAVEMDGSTPPGTYTLEYEICDTNTPANCETAEVVITVDADIVPVADTGSATSGTASTPVADVTTNDMVNGAPVDLTPGSGNATISEVGTWPAGLSLDPATGAVEMDGSTPPGTYTLEYEICDTNTPANCETAEVVITVDADIVPVADTGSATSGTASTPVADVTTNDMVNGAPVDLTPGSGNATISEVGTWPAGLSLDPATGAVEMDGSTPPGTYTLEYEICDTNTPANCETAEVVITVDADIVPVADTGSATSGTASTPVADVTTNDMVNGAPVDLTPGSGNATISEVGTWPAGLSLDPATGAVEMDGSTPPGTYTLEYEICDTNTPANCETAEVVITVDADIVPVADTGSATSGTASTPVADVTTNDMVNGAPVDLTPGSGNATISEVGTWPAGLSLDPATGAVEMDGSTPPGTYTLEYEICDTNTPANCETAEVVITVDADIVPVADTGSATSGTASTPVADVTTNDMVNGAPVDLTPGSGNATISEVGTWPAGLSLDPATGAVEMDGSTPPGTYTLEYEICDTNTPANCETAEVVITVDADIVPVADTGSATSGTASTPVADVTTNDMVNGAPVDLTPGSGNATISEVGTWPAGLSLDPATGAVEMDGSTPPGTYTLEYEICDTNTPANCETAEVVITVDADIVPVADTGSATSGTASTPVADVTTNDMVNGAPVDLTPGSGNATISEVGTWPAGLSLDPATGAVEMDGSTPPGTYTLEYEICDTNTPANCETAEVTIVVEPSTALLSGVVYLDTNGNNQPDADETVYAGWVVKVLDDKGNVIAEVITDENGYYEVELPFGDFTVEFINPDNGAVFGTAEIEVGESTKLPNGELAAVLNLPIDPSGVVYDSITRMPVQNVVMTMVDANGSSLPPLCFVDPSQQDQTTDSNGMYRFDIVPGADVACPVGQTDYRIIFDAPESHLDTNSSVIGVQPGFLSTPAGTGPFLVAPLATAPQNGDDTTYYLGFTLGTGSRDVINNHIPLDPITLVRSPLDVVKSSPRRDVNFGDIVPYTITVTNTEDIPRVDLDIIDFTPPGFKYVEDTSRLDGAQVDPEINGRELILNDYDFAANETKTWRMMMVVGAGVSDGIYTNQAYIRDPLGTEVSDRAEAVVRVTPDPLFDCSELIGKVFDDRNKDGYQNEGEPGMAGVRLATAKGLLVTTDDKGRYHIACAAIPNGQIGSNFILKVDERTLPTGYHLTSENPRVVRLTRGKMSKANFGAALENIVTLDVTDAAFEAGSDTLKPEFSGQLGQIVDALKGQGSTLRLTYYPSFAGRDERIDELSAQIQELWEVYGGDYDLNIERKTVWPDGNFTQQSGAGE